MAFSLSVETWNRPGEVFRPTGEHHQICRHQCQHRHTDREQITPPQTGEEGKGRQGQDNQTVVTSTIEPPSRNTLREPPGRPISIPVTNPATTIRTDRPDDQTATVRNLASKMLERETGTASSL